MRTRGIVGAVMALAVAGVATLTARPADSETLFPNVWLDRQRLNIAHQGGEIEAPSNTLYAFKTAAAKGADVLELDVHMSSDGHLVVIHDSTVNRTTGGSGRVDGLSLNEIKQLDAAFYFIPGNGTDPDGEPEEYVFRGIATGQKSPPDGYFANDFTIPTLDEVLDTFPGALVNIEIKQTAPDTLPYEKTLAEVLSQHGRRGTHDTIVVSFLDHATEMFKLWAPDVDTALATGQVGAFWASSQGPLPGSPNPRYQALQVPITFNGVTVVSEDFIANAHAGGLAVHVWTINTVEEMCFLLEWGADGIMTDKPTLLEGVLNGSERCP